ncbi:MAG: HEPN domain-containing protein [Candidatus Pacearchaeota archaeon]
MKEESKNYLRMSLEDLESSMILYSHNKYPQAIFLLQQSIEKTTKGITGTFDHNHRALNIYKEMVNKNLKKEIEETFRKDEFQVNDEKTLLVFIDSIKLLLFEQDSYNSPLKVGKITVPNFLLQQILFKHVNSARYPKGEYTPLIEYTSEHFLIKHYNKLYDLQKACLDECFKFIT